MNDLNIWIDIAAIVILIAFTIISRFKGKKKISTTYFGTLAKISVLLGVIIGKDNLRFSYSLLGLGVLLGLIDLIINLTGRNLEFLNTNKNAGKRKKNI